jgi:hypothetical protein
MRRLIVGGVVISVDRAPFQVRLYNDMHTTVGFCGGSLVSPTAVLTAAHCVDGVSAADGLVAGVFQTDVLRDPPEDVSAYGDVVPVAEVHVHPEYEASDVAAGRDVAVLRLSRPPSYFGTPFGPKAIALDNGTFWPSDKAAPLPRAYVSGYGSVDAYNGLQSYWLRAAQVLLYTRQECEALLGGTLSRTNLCAGLQDVDACSGDSGGPLLVGRAGAYVQTGIVSWGVGECGSAPGVYEVVHSARSFVRSLVPDAVFVDYAEDDPALDACACSNDCLSGGFDVAPRCACADHNAQGETFCYVQGGTACETASASLWMLGVAYRPCVPPPPLVPPPLVPPPLVPPPLVPPPLQPPATVVAKPPPTFFVTSPSSPQEFVYNASRCHIIRYQFSSCCHKEGGPDARECETLLVEARRCCHIPY